MMSLPLSIILEPKHAASTWRFSERAMDALPRSERLSGRMIGNRLEINGIWEPDIEAAMIAIRTKVGAEFIVSQLKIHFLSEPEPKEPILRIEVTTPCQWVGEIIGQINKRRGIATGLEDKQSQHIVTGIAPLAEMIGFPHWLRSATSRQSSAQAWLDGYAPVPSPSGGPDSDEPQSAALRA